MVKTQGQCQEAFGCAVRFTRSQLKVTMTAVTVEGHHDCCHSWRSPWLLSQLKVTVEGHHDSALLLGCSKGRQMCRKLSGWLRCSESHKTGVEPGTFIPCISTLVPESGSEIQVKMFCQLRNKKPKLNQEISYYKANNYVQVKTLSHQIKFINNFLVLLSYLQWHKISNCSSIYLTNPDSMTNLLILFSLVMDSIHCDSWAFKTKTYIIIMTLNLQISLTKPKGKQSYHNLEGRVWAGRLDSAPVPRLQTVETASVSQDFHTETWGNITSNACRLENLKCIY